MNGSYRNVSGLRGGCALPSRVLRPNELALTAQPEGSCFKKRRNVELACGKAIGELETIVGLNRDCFKLCVNLQKRAE